VPTNSTVSGFSIQVKVKTGQTAPLVLANIAQVFGKTPETNAPVLDESGDQNPSNFDGTPGNMTPPPNTDTNGDGVPDQLPPTVPDGYIDSATDLTTTGTDTAGNNTGDTNNTGANLGGEANVFTINLSSLLNGPKGFPGAVGLTNNNDDFTNKSSNVPPGLTPGSTFNPDAVNFTNTIRNTGNQTANISLVPTSPANTGDLPNGTVVTISYAAISATYTYDGTKFNFTNSAGFVGGNPIGASNPIRIDGVAVNATVDYSVRVDLPTDTPLSTDTNIQRGFPLPITAFIDGNGNGLADDGVTNITIDRVYTGFLQMIKQSRILPGTGPAVQGADGTLSTTSKTPAPGNIVEYVIQYKNISESQPASGNNNAILNVNKVVITEDGTVSPNNWAKNNDVANNTVIDTSHVAGSAQDSGGIITFSSGDPAIAAASNATSGMTPNTDVTKYVDTVTNQVAPSETGTFSFQRKVNNPSQAITIINMASATYEDPNNPNTPINSFSNSVAFTVTNVNEAPTVTSGASTNFAENGTGTVYTTTATDPDTGTTLTYSISGNDANLFNINSNSGEVTFKTAPNFEAPTDSDTNNVYDINVIASDGSLSASKVVAITVTNVNEAPTVALTNTITTLPENTSTTSGVKVADITITDDALGTNTLSVTGTDNSFFEIVSNALYIKAGTVLDYETKSSYSVQVDVNDPDVGSNPDDTKNYTLTLTDIKKLTVYNDIYYGTSDNEIIDALAGNDRIFGLDGDDIIYGRTGADILYGGTGADIIYGDEDDDRLYGDTGNDKIYGGAGADILYGGAGNDYLDGGTGSDRYYGEAGADTFVIGSGQGLDSIYDYEKGIDKIFVLGSIPTFEQKSGISVLIKSGTETLATVFNVAVGDIRYVSSVP
jgi:Ca2+-binding RTX toxin-like protein